MTDKLVSVDWVAEHRDEPDVRLIEVDVDTETYETEGHIAGAVALNWTTQLQDQLRRTIASQETIEELLGSCGVTPSTHVVLYGDHNNWFAAYALWLLEMYGHERVSLMDGGRVKWLSDGRPLSRDVPSVTAVEYRATPLDPALRATRSEVLAALDNGVQFVDVRSPAEFSGELIAPPGMSESAQRGGHIPGAINVPWVQAANEDGTFKSAKELRALYRDAGVDGRGPTISYCRIGERSSHTWFALKHVLGFENVKNYDGSWTEYGSMIDVPIER